MNDLNIDLLLDTAKKYKNNAYSPYSKFRVGAAVLAASGKIYAGSNVENASYGLTVCAERTAMLKAVSEGEREIFAVAIITDSDEIERPCGACLQVISEFCGAANNVKIICSNVNGKYDIKQLSDYLPMPFKFD